ncbi:MAG: MFS transporter, partial [Spirochaetia bacterium]|nr:MFS transporter [Spirochaetia bacterium]
RLFIMSLRSLSLAARAGFFSNSYIWLLAARIVQASGAGAIPALGMVFISRYVPVERRGAAMAIVMSGVAMGLGLGPVIGGMIVQFLGWHYLFLLTALTILLVPFFSRFIPDEKGGSGDFDIPGAILAGAGVTALLLAMTQRSLLALIAGSVAVLAFQWRIRRVASPFVLPALFTNQPFLKLAAVGIGAYMCSFAALYLLPQVLVHHFKLSPLQAGLAIFPGSFLSMLVSRRVGKIIDRFGNDTIIRLLPIALLASTVLFAVSGTDSYWIIIAAYSIMSLAFTFLISAVSNEISRILHSTQIGSGMGLFQLMQFFSGAFGVAATATTLAIFQPVAGEAATYSIVFWGMSFISLLAVGFAAVYVSQKLGSGQSQSPSLNSAPR